MFSVVYSSFGKDRLAGPGDSAVRWKLYIENRAIVQFVSLKFA